ncbi:hypothetical protein IAD21_06213 [Abditibacteriota bacterium]|nr:hypothetical protein IAD21_06213 [Abditibacteriota bacterium]
MRRLSHAELALFLAPLALVPLAIYGQRWKIAVTPRPTPSPRPKPTPLPNLHTNFGGIIQAVLPSADGKWVYTGIQGVATKPRFAKWDAKSGALIRRFGLFRVTNGGAVLSPNGRILGFGKGGWRGDRVVLFDTATGKERRQFISRPNVEGGFADFALNDEVVALQTDDDVRLVRITDGRFVGKLRHRTSDYYPKKPVFSPDGHQLAWIGFSNRDYDSYANGNSNDEIVWFDWKTRKRLGALEFSHSDLFNVRFSGDGHVLLVWGFHRYWVKSRTGHNDIATQEKMWAIDAHRGKEMWDWNMSGWGNNIGVSPNGRLFSAPQRYNVGQNSPDYTSIREVATNHEVVRLPLDSGYTSAWSSNSRTIYIPNYAGLMRVNRQTNDSWKSGKAVFGVD